MTKILKTAAEVIDFLGGHQAVAQMLRMNYPKAEKRVANWKYSDKLNPRTYVAIKKALWYRGADAPDELWDMIRWDFKDRKRGKRGRFISDEALHDFFNPEHPRYMDIGLLTYKEASQRPCVSHT